MRVYLHAPNAKGLVVQLVRIHACHAWGRGFESRPDRKLTLQLGGFFGSNTLLVNTLSIFI